MRNWFLQAASDHASDLSQIDAELTNQRMGLELSIALPTIHTIQHLVANFASAVEANKELDAALGRYNDAHMKVRFEDLVDASGKKIARRILATTHQANR